MLGAMDHSITAFVRPCIRMVAKTIPHGDARLHEPKLDGYRFQIVKDGRCCALQQEW